MSQLLCFKYEVFCPAPALSSSTVLSHTEQSTTRSRAWQVSTPTPGSVPPARSVSCSSPCSGQALTALQYPPDPQTSRYLDPRHRRQKVAGGPGAAAAQLSSERGAGPGAPRACHGGAVTCPPERAAPPPQPPETKFCSALTAIVTRVWVSQNFASGDRIFLGRGQRGSPPAKGRGHG